MATKEKLDIKYGYNPLDKYDTPNDALTGICCFTRFINEAIGVNTGDIEFSKFGKEGLLFYLNFIKGSMRQISHAIEAQCDGSCHKPLCHKNMTRIGLIYYCFFIAYFWIMLINKGITSISINIKIYIKAYNF